MLFVGYHSMELKAPIVDGRLYIRGKERLIALDLRVTPDLPPEHDDE